ncbi:MAG: FAD-dependent oxidoreductase [Lentimicrobium sp.]|jgi:NADPH-dependent 2,4-dienoyl-CoA reductase/sulfur reductase-like enzyme|nr:FAD-dependent oxidoreductase [Lentimicrobium sp.]MDD2528391.1 FAD-dependent oxidoreductase [Lentimicrobiaceae bacterium]MDD4598198.1 FAD-dependent oxidoreductase [Lentimicrobiaceae bacterium]MDY0026234.1 FAD-dependent oxidoreductase [Lentimicrobium sp.]HAH60037.1 flavoprotein oxidoreductase [Bacteroidales bacterium]
MNKRKLVVIGGDAAGMTAASKIRREQPEREIVVFERGNHTSYAACGMPYYIGGLIDSEENLIVRKPEVFRKKQHIDVRIRHEVTEIDTVKKRVKVRNIDKNMDFWETWDDLLIATGASPVVPQSENIDAPGIFSLSTLQSGINVNNFINENKPAKAVIVGGGYIGIEMAEALLARSIEVTIIDMAPQLMTSLDKDMSDQILAYLKEQQVKIFLEETLEKFTKNADGSVNSVITNKQTLPADIVIVGVGIKPNAGLAANAGIKIGKNGAIHINKRCETSALNIWAAGDCAESFHLITHEQVHIALGTVASKHGLTAGINISGGNMEFPGVMGTAITKFKEMEISRTGLSEKEAKNLNIDFETAMITTVSPASYYPDAKEISVKLVINKQSRRILGGQIVGFEGTGKRIDSIVTAITAGFTAQQLMDLDLAYAPPFSNVWDPVQIAARRLL